MKIRMPAEGKWQSLAVMSAVLSGCSALLGGSDNAASGFASVSENQIDIELDGEINRTISDPAVGTVAFLTGHKLSPGFLLPAVTSYAYSGIAPGHDTGVAVTGGTATYDANYAYAVVDSYDTSFFGVTGRRDSGAGSIGLKADFDAGTLTGAVPDLRVDGLISGDRVSGSVEVFYDTNFVTESITGTLSGYIGNTGTIGAFHGNDADTAAAGGFVGTAN